MYVSNKSVPSFTTTLNGTLNYISDVSPTYSFQYTVYLNLSKYNFDGKVITNGVKISDIPTAPSNEKDAVALDAPDISKHALVFYTTAPADSSIPLTRLKKDDLLISYAVGTCFLVFAKNSDNKLIIYAFQYKILSENFQDIDVHEPIFNPNLRFFK